MMHKAGALLLILAFFIMSGVAVIASLPALPDVLPAQADQIAGAATTAMARGMRDMPYISEIAPTLRARLGQRLQNGVYAADTMLIEVFTEPDPDKTDINNQLIGGTVTALTERYNAALDESYTTARRVPVYFMLVPTAEAIKKQEMPAYTYQIDQKQIINTVYYQSGLPGAPNLNPVRAYEALDRARDEDIYYRTDPRLTGLGGYYLYLDLASTMRLAPVSLGRFWVTHVERDYRGSLAPRAYSNHVRADLVSMYTYSDADTEYRVVHYDGEDRRYYNSLFPLHTLELGDATDIVLGGKSPRIDILAASDYDESLLILADHTVQSYISFLAVHFKQITVLDIDTIDETLMQDVDVVGYDRILISLSLDTYAHNEHLGEALELLYYRAVDPAHTTVSIPERPTATTELPAAEEASSDPV